MWYLNQMRLPGLPSSLDCKGSGFFPLRNLSVRSFWNRWHACFVAVVRQFCWRIMCFLSTSDFPTYSWWIIRRSDEFWLLPSVWCNWCVCLCVYFIYAYILPVYTLHYNTISFIIPKSHLSSRSRTILQDLALMLNFHKIIYCIAV